MLLEHSFTQEALSKADLIALWTAAEIAQLKPLALACVRKLAQRLTATEEKPGYLQKAKAWLVQQLDYSPLTLKPLPTSQINYARQLVLNNNGYNKKKVSINCRSHSFNIKRGRRFLSNRRPLFIIFSKGSFYFSSLSSAKLIVCSSTDASLLKSIAITPSLKLFPVSLISTAGKSIVTVICPSLIVISRVRPLTIL